MTRIAAYIVRCALICIKGAGVDIKRPNGVVKGASNCIKACLRCVCPDAQDVREICNLNHAHLAPF